MAERKKTMVCTSSSSLRVATAPAQTGEMLLARTTAALRSHDARHFRCARDPDRGVRPACAGSCLDVCRRGGVRLAGRNWNRRDGGHCFEISATGPASDLLTQSADYAAFESHSPIEREHAGFFPEALLFRSASVSGDDRSRSHLKERPLERAMAEPGYLVGVCGRFVFAQRVAVPKALKRRIR